jgi:hypothetical protein
MTGDSEDPAFARVALLTARPTGVMVHLESLPAEHHQARQIGRSSVGLDL